MFVYLYLDPNAVWRSSSLIPLQSFYGKRAKSLEKFFLQFWKCNLVDFIEIPGNRLCKYKHSLTKIETSYIVVFWMVVTADL